MYKIINVPYNQMHGSSMQIFVEFVHPLPQKAVFSGIQQEVKCIQPRSLHTTVLFSYIRSNTLSAGWAVMLHIVVVQYAKQRESKNSTENKAKDKAQVAAPGHHLPCTCGDQDLAARAFKVRQGLSSKVGR